ncbi:ABC transporter permease [Umezawaea sp. Da 62-37]|uniref:ABC transporter permease n=1 Tax=Umezawaea sp. Da 62-37 TaxID=3075927 RepID=UPI0028F708E6|nr:ABC transporter permease [Umezawaea sp. Da 62-37]WNV88365.1 ABC transporter permease [Umezawaea sp. Da 62-37]
MTLYHAELRKLLTLPSARAGFALGLVLPPGILMISAVPEEASRDAGFVQLILGVIGAIVLGVVSTSSEYTAEGEDSPGGRQITTSLTGTASRARFLAAKAGALASAVAVLALVTATLTLALTRPLPDNVVPRVVGVVVYWTLTALLAHAITLLTRNGVVPLTLLILNTSVVSVTFLLSKITPLAAYFPDMAGSHMFLHRIASPVDIAPITGGLVMAAWVFALLAVAAVVVHRRDA